MAKKNVADTLLVLAGVLLIVAIVFCFTSLWGFVVFNVALFSTTVMLMGLFCGMVSLVLGVVNAFILE